MGIDCGSLRYRRASISDEVRVWPVTFPRTVGLEVSAYPNLGSLHQSKITTTATANVIISNCSTTYVARREGAFVRERSMTDFGGARCRQSHFRRGNGEAAIFHVIRA